jgi:hypothetical protein
VKREQTREELLEHFAEQIRFLKRSALQYDAGDFGEAKRIATVLRTLFHETGNSRALLTSLGILLDLLMYDSSEGGSTVGRPTYLHGMVFLRLSQDAAYVVATTDEGRPGPVPPRIPFAQWWINSVYTHQSSSTTFSRKELVLYLANQDGGAHVDQYIDEKWAHFTRDHAYDAVGAVIDGKVVPFKGLETAHVRQIAHEAFHSLRERSELTEIFAGLGKPGS